MTKTKPSATPINLFLLLIFIHAIIITVNAASATSTHQRNDDDFIPTLQRHSDHKKFLSQHCDIHEIDVHAPRNTLALIYPKLPSLLRQLKRTTKKQKKQQNNHKKATTRWLLETAFIHVGDLRSALDVTRKRNKQQKIITTASDLLNHALRLVRLLQGNAIQYLIFNGSDFDQDARNVFVQGCARSGGSSRNIIEELLMDHGSSSNDFERIGTASVADIVCHCVGHSIHDRTLWPTWTSRRYHELELSKMLNAASAVGLNCFVTPIFTAAKQHPKATSSADVAQRLAYRLPLEFAGAKLPGDERMKLGALGTAATYGWSTMVSTMLQQGACVPFSLYQIILNHVDYIFSIMMPLFIHHFCDHSLIQSMKEAKDARKQLRGMKRRSASAAGAAGAVGNGGWKVPDALDVPATELCGIDSVHINDVTTATLLETVYENKPIVVRGALYGNEYDDIRLMFEKKNLLHIMKNVHVEMSTIPYPKLFLRNSSSTSIAAFLQLKDGITSRVPTTTTTTHTATMTTADPPYIFVPCPTAIKNVVSHVMPHQMNGEKSDLISKMSLCEFFVGLDQTGSPAHWHVLAMNSLVHGEKKWLLAPPSASFHSRKPARSFWRDNVPKLLIEENADHRYLTCTQHSGDLLIVPRFWMHSTLNVQENTGYAIEFNTNVISPKIRQPKD